MSRSARREAAARRELAVTAYHEAGHAVVSVATGAPMHGVWIKVSRPLFGQPVGYGKTKVSRIGGTFIKSELMEAYVIASLAGVEAEAMFLYAFEGINMRQARQRSAAHNRGEIDYAEETLREAVAKGWVRRLRTVSQAQAATRKAVANSWPAIDRLARELVRRQSLKERDVRRIVGRAA